MAPPPLYSQGTINVAANGTTVTGIGTAWAGVVRRGSILQAGTSFGIVTSDPDVPTDLPTDTSIKLFRPWGGGALTSQPYGMLIAIPGAAFSEAFIAIMQRLNGRGTVVVTSGTPLAADGRDNDLRIDPTTSQIFYKTGGSWEELPIGGGGGGGGAPTTAPYIVSAADGGLSAERVLTATASISWDFATAAQAKANVVTDGISNLMLRNSAALSVIGRSANSVGDPADIAAATDGHVLRRSGTTLGFGTVPSTSITGLGGLATAAANMAGITTGQIPKWDGTQFLPADDDTATGGSGAPTDAIYLVQTAHGGLSAERVITNTATIAADFATAAQAQFNVVDDSIIFAKMQNIATDRLLGRDTAASGDVEEISLTDGLRFTGATSVGAWINGMTDLAAPARADEMMLADASASNVMRKADLASIVDLAQPTESIVIAVGDEATALTAGTGKVTFRMPYAFSLTGVRASLATAQASGSIFTVDLNEAGTSILSTKLTIDNTEKTSVTAATAAVISDAALADDAEITIDIDQIGNGSAKGLKIALIGRRT